MSTERKNVLLTSIEPVPQCPKMPKIIRDHLRRKPISRQMRYKLRMQRAGRCCECGQKRKRGIKKCADCAEKDVARMQERRRNEATVSHHH